MGAFQPRTHRRPVTSIPSYAVIIRATHERRPSQEEALVELSRRGLHLSDEQYKAAGAKIEERYHNGRVIQIGGWLRMEDVDA